jgi:protein-tyrosine phosphatase
MDIKIKINFSKGSGAEGMIDLHTHLLPDWDDGPETWEETAEMVQIAVNDGIDMICLTPHIFRFSRYQDSQEALENRFNEFNVRFGSDERIQFFRGGEIFIHPEIVREVRERNLSLNGSEYVFVEFPVDQVPAGAKGLFFQMMLAGFTPIISHPERNSVLGNQPELLYDLVSRGCLAQVTANSLTGKFGDDIQQKAELFLKNHLVQLIASDAHDAKRRKPVLSQGVEAAARITDWDVAEAMVRGVPRAILNNEIIPDLGNPTNPMSRKKFFGLFKKK